ncbi:hypothetical protein LGH82_01480 [Mesorhizobium sp. PAMC28654]|uniref:DUF6894 family protein n=1 Tax=Mesorhizobium sp. PAMC28654 TaxID=2880934 RepID=UPI001D0A4E1A|nr:hypothetical protein [Mesorhizobium sp. PAMC28654]UDL90102.1 hypothetical protein LGH82_01480 [Mesorhizobium sp. PAMC28654]
MPRYFFDIYDGAETTVDEAGIGCNALSEVSDHAVALLPDIARDELPDGPNRIFWVKVRGEDGEHVYRATLALSSAWLVDDTDGRNQPGEELATAAMRRTSAQIKAIRRDLAEDGFMAQMQEIDSLMGVAQLETDRLLKRTSAKVTS